MRVLVRACMCVCAVLPGDWLPGARCFPIKPVTGVCEPPLLHEEQGERESEGGGERVLPAGAGCAVVFW